MLYRGIDLHDNVTFNTNPNKNIFITNQDDTATVKIPIYLNDISDYFRQLTFPLEFCEYDISIEVVNEIYYKTAAMNIESQTIKSAYLFIDVCYLDEKNNLDYLKNINKFNKTIAIFDNNVVINHNKIVDNNFTIHMNNVYNCKNMYLINVRGELLLGGAYSDSVFKANSDFPIFCRSRPFDLKECVKSNSGTCEVCPLIAKGGGCSKRGVVYEIICNLCGEKYQGETDRPLNNRIAEHIRAARNLQSYPNNALGHHYNTAHPNCQVDINVVILDIQRNSLKRKLSEALYISRSKPSLNDKSELESIVKYL